MRIILKLIRRVYSYLVRNINKIWRKIINLFEPSIVLIVGQACNLKCVNCANFCPISLTETKSYPVEKIIESLQIILNNCYRIPYLQIQGGEPFIYKDLIKLMEYLRTQKKILTIDFATNGMIIPSEEVLNTIKKDSRIRVRISDYKLSTNALKLKKVLDVMGIVNYYYEFAGNKGEWRDMGGGWISALLMIKKRRNILIPALLIHA